MRPLLPWLSDPPEGVKAHRCRRLVAASRSDKLQSDTRAGYWSEKGLDHWIPVLLQTHMKSKTTHLAGYRLKNVD